MKSNSIFTAGCMILFLMNLQAAGQTSLTANTLRLDEDGDQIQAKLEDFAWLTGYWVGEGLGGECEETWMPARGGRIAGTFRLLQNEQLRFSEFFQLGEHDGRWTLRLKHFDPQMKGWEEKDGFVEFPLIRVESNAAFFNGLTYRLTNPNELDVYLAFKQKDGTFREEQIRFRRKALTD